MAFMAIFPVCGYIEQYTNYWRGFKDENTLIFPKITNEAFLRARIKFWLFEELPGVVQRALRFLRYHTGLELKNSVLCENDDWGRTQHKVLMVPPTAIRKKEGNGAWEGKCAICIVLYRIKECNMEHSTQTLREAHIFYRQFSVFGYQWSLVFEEPDIFK